MKTKVAVTTERVSKKKLIILAVFIFILIAAGGMIYYTNQSEAIRKENLDEFKTISNLKISQLTQWNNERSSDIKVISHSFKRTDKVQKWLLNPRNLVLENEMLELLKNVQKFYQYADIFISSVNGNVLLDVNGIEKSQIFIHEKMLESVISSKDVAFSDLYRCPIQKDIHYDIAAPIESQDEKILAILIFRVEPDNFLYPLIQDWPSNSKTAETLIFRQEGDSVLFLNNLRHIKNTALKLKISLSEKEVPAVQAVLGRRGFFEGYDYRNVKVLSYLSDVPNTPWMMIAKIDSDEIFDELDIRATTIVMFSLLLMMLAGGGLVYIYSSSQKNTYKELFNKEKELRESQEKFKTILYSIGDAVITTDKKGNVQQLNGIAEQLTGWMEWEVKGKPLNEIFNIVNQKTRQKVENPVQNVLKSGSIIGLANHTVLISRDSQEYMISDSGAPIRNEDGEITGVVLVFRDQTSEYTAQQRLQESEEKFRNLFNSVSIPLCAVKDDGQILLLNNRFVSDIGYTIEDMPTINEWWQLAYPNEEYRKWVIENWNKAVQRSTEEGTDIKSDIYDVTCKNGQIKKMIIAGITFGTEVLSTFIDVTEQKAAEKNLTTEKEFTDAVINALPGIFYLFDQNGKFVKWNNTLADLSGLSYEEVGKKSPIDFIAEHDKNKITEAINTAFTEGEVIVEADFLAFGRENIPFYFTGRRIQYDDNSLLLGVGVDLSAKKKAEEERDRFFKVSLNLLSIAGTDGYFKEMNPAWEEVVGWTVEELKSKPFFDFIHPDDIESTVNEVEKLKDGRPTINFTNRYLHKNGSYRKLTWTTAPFGNLLYASATDITELTNAQMIIEQSEKRYKSLFSNSPVSIWDEDWSEVIELIKDIKTNGINDFTKYFNDNMDFVHNALSKVKIVNVNLETLKMFEVENQDEFLKSLEVVFATDDTLTGFIGELVALAEGKEFYETEIALNTAKGNLIHTFLRMTFPQQNDNSGQVLVSIMDISPLKEAEEKLHTLMENLKRSNQELEQFAYVASHDLQEPLRMVSSYTQLLQRRYKDKLDQDANDFIHYAVDGANRMQILINDLLQFSRITTRGKEFELTDLNEVLGQTILNFKSKIDDTNTIILNDELPEVYVDSSQISRLFQNLITNSIKYCSDVSPRIHITWEDKISHIQFAFKDNGIGIDEEYNERIFEIFERLHTKDKYEGTGIGLAICKKIVERHGGKIWVESKKDEGSKFFFTIKK